MAYHTLLFPLITRLAVSASLSRNLPFRCIFVENFTSYVTLYLYVFFNEPTINIVRCP